MARCFNRRNAAGILGGMRSDDTLASSPKGRVRGVLRAMLHRLGLVLFGVLLAALALEVVLRVWDAVPEVGSPLYGFHDTDADLGWAGKPNVRLRYHRPEFDTLVELDAAGWRKPQPSVPADPMHRVLVLGDSYTWGWGVAQGELFTDRLQVQLAPTVAVYNRGVIGFGTAQEYLLLKRELAAHRYDTVVLMFYLNDIADNIDGKDGHRPYFDLLNGGLVPRNQPTLARTSPVRLFFRDHSRAYMFLEFEIGMLKRRFKGEAEDEREYKEVAAIDFHDLPGYEVTARLLGEMNRLVRAHGARFFLVYIPHRSEVEHATGYPYARAVRAMIDDIAQREGITVIDLRGPFRAHAEAKQTLVYPIDGHWTPAGHQLAATVLRSSPIFAQSDAAGETQADRP